MKLEDFPRAVLFDLDGTLLDNSPIVIEAYYSGMEKLGYKPKNREFISSLLGNSTFEIGKALSLKDEDLPYLDAHFWDYFGMYAEDPGYIPIIYSGVKEVLELFYTKSVPIGICTSNRSKFARALIKKVNLDKYITTYVGSEDVDEKKPSPKPLLLALQNLGLTKSNQKDRSLWFIGDSSPDIQAAQNAGIVSVGVPEKDKLDSVKSKNPDLLFNSMKDFYLFINQNFY